MEQLELFDVNEQQFYVVGENKPTNIVLRAGQEEMIKITPTGFYVRGVAVEQDAGEALSVYQAFKQWMVWASLTRNS